MAMSNVLMMVLGLAASVNPGLAADDKPAPGGAAPAGAAVLCPVSGEAADLSVSTAADEGPVFFCCKKCVSTFEADRAKFATQVAAQRTALASRPKVQVRCPISGEPVDSKAFLEADGKKVFFCCSDCALKYKADPAKYQSKLANSFSYQTMCPVMGEEIDPKVSSSLASGQTVYFCCKKCIAKFQADTSKYAPKLASQGVNIDAAKVAPGK